MSKSHWHYPRTGFLDTVFQMMTSGPAQALSLFGPRRIGKTQFLLYDLAPRAEMYRHKVGYASFWQTTASPLAVLLYELEQALYSGPGVNRLWRGARGLAPKLRLRSPDGRGEIEIDLANLGREVPADHLLLMDQYCDRLANTNHPTFLLFDEFQEVAKVPNAEPLIAALRTSLDKRKDGLSVLFTGSSQQGLSHVFSTRDAPFYRFATPIELPALGLDFVHHQLAAYAATYRRELDPDQAYIYFDAFGQNPMLFQRWLNAMPLAASAQEARDRVEQDLEEEFSFAETWLSLTDNQRLVLRMVAEDVGQMFGADGRDFARRLRGDPLSSSAIQAALRKLSALNLVDKWDDEWHLGDPMFEVWIRRRPDTDF
jgi:hypothetical protein